MTPQVDARFASAEDHIRSAVSHLIRLRMSYETLQPANWKPRVQAINAKIDALQAVTAGLNPHAHPWVADWKEAS